MKFFYGLAFLAFGFLGLLPDVEQPKSDAAAAIAFAAIAKEKPAPPPVPVAPEQPAVPVTPLTPAPDPQPAPAPEVDADAEDEPIACTCGERCSCKPGQCFCAKCKQDGTCCPCGRAQPAAQFHSWFGTNGYWYGKFEGSDTTYCYVKLTKPVEVTEQRQVCYGDHCELQDVTVTKNVQVDAWVKVVPKIAKPVAAPAHHPAPQPYRGWRWSR